jgi:hypothetical protein
MHSEYTHHIALFKTRSASGQGMHIAYRFDPESLTMDEMGWIARDK